MPSSRVINGTENSSSRVTVVPLPQRLLDADGAAAYLGGISTSTLRALIEQGHLIPVRLPAVRQQGESGRRLLFDVRDLDQLIDRLKSSGTNAPNAQLSAASLTGWERRHREARS